MNAPPAALPVHTNAIPARIKEIPQWVAWRWEFRPPKWTKPPTDCRTGHKASSTDPATWVPFGAAYRYAQRWCLPGIGLVLTADLGIVAVDLDKCHHDAVIDPWAAEIIAACASYTEVSPSGTGIRILVGGTLPVKGKRKGSIEVYKAERYVTITGHMLADVPPTVEPSQTAVDALIEQLGGVQEIHPFPAWAPSSFGAGDLRERAASGRIRRDTLALLDSTGPDRYASASEADSAIACGLITAGLSPSDALALIRESIRGFDAGRRKGPHVDAYWHRTVEHAASFASPLPTFCGIRVQPTNGARSLREMSTGSRYSQIHTNSGHQRESSPDAPAQKSDSVNYRPAPDYPVTESPFCEAVSGRAFTPETTELREYVNNVNLGGL